MMMNTFGSHDEQQPGRRLAGALVPIVRRTLQIGDGPPLVLSVARSLGLVLGGRSFWTGRDERLARNLARRIGRLLASRKAVDARFGYAECAATLNPAAITEIVREVRA